MRSRNGNHYFTLSLIFFYSLVLNASEYNISYRYVVKDSIIYNETLLVSKAMTKCLGSPQKALYLEYLKNKDLKSILFTHRELFIDYLHKLGLYTKSYDRIKNYNNHSTTILTLKTTCFKVDFNENFVKISPLK